MTQGATQFGGGSVTRLIFAPLMALVLLVRPSGLFGGSA